MIKGRFSGFVLQQKEKEALKMLEMTYGSQPSTPKKKIVKLVVCQCSNISSYNLLLFRRPAGSPLAATAPSKVRKVEQSPLVRPTTAAGSRLPRAASRKRNAKVKHRLL